MSDDATLPPPLSPEVIGHLDADDDEQATLADTFAEHVQPLRAEWLTAPPNPREWLATIQPQDDDSGGSEEQRLRRRRGLLARRELHVLAGEGGAGKGRFAMQLALAVAAAAPSGEGKARAPFSSRLGLDVHPSSRDEKVLFLVGEDDEQEIQTRAYGAQQVEGFSRDELERITARVRWRSFRGSAFRLVEEAQDRRGVVESDDFRNLRAFLEQHGPWALIVIDPLARFLGVEENDNGAMHRAAAIVEGLCEAPGNPAVLVVAHTRKPNKNDDGALSQHDVRGASSVVNAARLVAVMTPHAPKAIVTGDGAEAAEGSAHAREIHEVGVRLSVVKNNLSPKGGPLTLMFHEDGGLHVETPAEQEARRSRQHKGGRPLEGNPKKPATAEKGAGF